MTNQADKKRPVAVILADQLLESDLKTIFGENSKSSLMIAGYSLIEHTLMELRDLGFEHVIILAKHDANRIHQLIGNTQRWAMNINVMQFSLTTNQVLQEYKTLSDPHGLLVIETDQLRSRCIEDFLVQCKQSEYALLEAVIADQRSGVTLLKPSSASFIINPMPIELTNKKSTQLTNCHDFHRANFDVITRQYTGIEPSISLHSKTGHRQHWSAFIHKKTKLKTKDLMIDHHCHVGQNTQLDSVILNHDVYVDQLTSLTNTIVMPNSMIAKQNIIRNAVVNNNVVYTIQ